MSMLRQIEVTQLDKLNILVILKEDSNVQYQLTRSMPGVRWRVRKLSKVGGYWMTNEGVLDTQACSQDIINNIRKYLY